MRPPKSELEKYSVNYSKDTDFSAHARLLQSVWRESKNLPFNQTDKGKNYGNFLPPEIAIKSKANFLTPKIRLLAEYEILRKGNFGKLIKEDRMWENLLSSQPLCFNLFGELHFDFKLATKFFKRLFPERIGTVTEVLFEHSPSRGDKYFTGDRSAFDAFIEYTRENKRGFIGIEVKYAESLREETIDTANAIFVKHEQEYLRLTSTDIFREGTVNELRKPPVSQIWRDHLLALATRQIYDEGFFVFLYPSQNTECKNSVDEYQQYLASTDEAITGFYPKHLEEFVNLLIDVSRSDWAKELKSRYIGKIEKNIF